MILYHGGLIEVKSPRILATEHVGDFGATLCDAVCAVAVRDRFSLLPVFCTMGD